MSYYTRDIQLQQQQTQGRGPSKFCTVFRTNIGPNSHHNFNNSYSVDSPTNHQSSSSSHYNFNQSGNASYYSAKSSKSYAQSQRRYLDAAAKPASGNDLDKLLDDLLGVARAASLPSANQSAPSKSYVHVNSHPSDVKPFYPTKSSSQYSNAYHQTYNHHSEHRDIQQQQPSTYSNRTYSFTKSLQDGGRPVGSSGKQQQAFETERERYLARELKKTQKKLNKLRRAASECGYDLEEERRLDFQQNDVKTSHRSAGKPGWDTESYGRGRSRHHSESQDEHRRYRFMSEEPVFESRKVYTASRSNNAQVQPVHYPERPSGFSTLPAHHRREHVAETRDTFDSKLEQLEKSLDRARDRIKVVSGPGGATVIPVQRYASAVDVHRSEQQHQQHHRDKKFYQERTIVHEPADVYQEVETITLQPIGKGIHDLEPDKHVSRRTMTLNSRRGQSLTQSVPHLATTQQMTSTNTRHVVTNRRAATLRSSTPQPTTPRTPLQVEPPQPFAVTSPQAYSSLSSRRHHEVHAGSLPPSLPDNIMYYDSPDSMMSQQRPAETVVQVVQEPVRAQQYETSHRKETHVFHGSNLDTASRRRGHLVQQGSLESTSSLPVGDPMSPGAMSTSTNISSVSADSQAQSLQPGDTMQIWYRPSISRDEAINMLRDAQPGTFVVRDSNSFPGAFGLAVRVAQIPRGIQPKTSDLTAELVRHFLIEPSGGGVRLKGCANEPVFPSLAALVSHHAVSQLALPCKLLLPEASSAQQLLKQGAACTVLYLGSVDVGQRSGPEALSQACDVLLRNRGSLRTTETQFKVSSEGVTLTDNHRKLFFRKHYPAGSLIYCDLDPADRRYVFPESTCRGLGQPRLFGFLAKKSPSGGAENVCIIVCELETTQPATAVVTFVNRYLLSKS